MGYQVRTNHNDAECELLLDTEYLVPGIHLVALYTFYICLSSVGYGSC